MSSYILTYSMLMSRYSLTHGRRTYLTQTRRRFSATGGLYLLTGGGLIRVRLLRVLDPVFPVAGLSVQVHNSDNLQLGTAETID